MKKVKQILEQSIATKTAILENLEIMSSICDINQLLYDRFSQGQKLLLCGNGGSASDAQHLAAEFSGRFLLDRDSLFAEALHVNSSALTAIANDYGYAQIYARMLAAKGKTKDVLWAFSTSGNSANIVAAVQKAKQMGMTTIGMTGANIGAMDSFCDYLIKVPSESTPRIQEAHITIGHIICEIVELKLFGN